MARTRKDAGGQLIYAASERHADLLYISGFMAPDAFLWFRVNGTAGVLVSPLEFGRAGSQVNDGVRVLSFAEARTAWGVTNAQPGICDYIAGLSQTEKVSVWQVPDDFPLGLARKLNQEGLTLAPQEEMFPDRAQKTSREVAAVRTGVELAEAGLDAAVGVLKAARPGRDRVLQLATGELITAEFLQGTINAEIARLGGTASHTIVAPGRQGADPHQTGTGPVRADEAIVIDIFPRVDRTGYHGDLTRTIVKGRAPAEVRQAFDAVLAAQTAAIDAVKAGARAAEVHRAAADILDRSGHETDIDASPPRGFFHGLGHGLGLEVHEAPRVNACSTAVLEEGNVITIEPGLYFPEWGGVRLEDVVVVQEDGCETLTKAPKLLEID